jgi:Protein of unknown function (DUF3833)
MQRRPFLLGLFALPLAACATIPVAPPQRGTALTLVSAFQGRTTGTGVFKVFLTGAERRFTAALNGTVRGKPGSRVLTVVEDFVYDDGQKDRLTWVFRETGPGRWGGKREDTVGEALAVEENGVIRLTYLADFRAPTGVTRLGFEDVIYADASGEVINDGIVTRGGVAVGAVRFVIRRT